MKTFYALILLFAAVTVICAEDNRPPYQKNGDTYDIILKKVKGMTQFDEYKKVLDPKEFTFFVASMHYGVTANGGIYHGFDCFKGPDLKDVVQCLNNIGAKKRAAVMLDCQKQHDELLLAIPDKEKFNEAEDLLGEKIDKTAIVEDEETVEKLLLDYYHP